MSVGVAYIRALGRSNKIPIFHLEKFCDLANGYLNPKKQENPL